MRQTVQDLVQLVQRPEIDGHVTGLCARGDFEMDIVWRDGALVRAAVRSKLGAPCIVRYKGLDLPLKIRAGGVATLIVQNGQLAPDLAPN